MRSYNWGVCVSERLGRNVAVHIPHLLVEYNNKESSDGRSVLLAHSESASSIKSSPSRLRGGRETAGWRR
jgi:hypothetical protein